MTDPRRSERGIALILVLVILPLVAIVMTQLGFETAIGDRLADNTLANQQFKLAILARIRQMRLRLVRDLKDDERNAAQQGGAYDHYGDLWGPDHEGGKTAVVVTRGDPDRGDEIRLYTECVDEQGKFNLNLMLHKDQDTAQRAQRRFVRLLDLFRDYRYDDLQQNEYDVNEVEAQEIMAAVLKFMRGETREGPVPLPKPDLPDPAPQMAQGVFSPEDLVFAHRAFVEKRLLERFTDSASGQVLPGLTSFVTVYGDGKVNANTAPVQVLRALFAEEGQDVLAENILHGRGGFLPTPEDQDQRRQTYEEREEAEAEGREDETEPLAYTSLNDLSSVDGLGDGPTLRRNDVDLARDFTVRTNFFTVVVTARQESFMRQHQVVLQRHANGCLTWSTQVRTADTADLPDEGPGAEEAETEEP